MQNLHDGRRCTKPFPNLLWVDLAVALGRGSTNHQQGVTTVCCRCPACGPLKRATRWAPSHTSRRGEAWVVGGFQYISSGRCAGPPPIMQISSFHTVCRPLSGGQPHRRCGEGVFFDRNKPPEQGSGPRSSPFAYVSLLGQGKLYQGSGISGDARLYRVVPKRSGRTRARGDIMGGGGAVGHVSSHYSLLLHPSSSTAIFCGRSRGSTGYCSCKRWLKGSINRGTEQVAEEAHRISLAAGSTDDAGVWRLLPNTFHEEACY